MPLIEIGTRIDFGDEGEGKILARNGNDVFLMSAVFTGWVDECELFAQLLPYED